MAHNFKSNFPSGKDHLVSRLILSIIDLRLVNLIPGLGKEVFRTFATALVSSSASLLLLYFVSLSLSGLIDQRSIYNIIPVLIAMILMLLTRILAEVYRERYAYSTSALMKRVIRSRLYTKILELGPSYTDNKDSGSIAAIFVDGTEQLEQYVAYYIPYILLSIIVPIGLFIGFACFVDLITALILLVFVPLVPVSIMLTNRQKRLKRTDVWSDYKSLSAFYSESLQGLSTFKLFNQQKKRAAEIRRMADKLSSSWNNRLKIGLVVSFVSEMIPYLGYGSAMLYVCIRMSQGIMHTEQVMFVLLLGPVFYEHINHLSEYYHNSINAKSTINTVVELVNTPPLIKEPEISGSLILPNPGAIKFSNVSFEYEKNRPVLNNCSFTIMPGEKVAFVGASGVGKSTVIDLLFRYYDPDEGSVEVGGISVRNIPGQQLRSMFSLVSQDTYLFYDTIRNNLLFGRPDASLEELNKAIHLSRLDDFISNLPDGLDTISGERGLRLSGGERQRIAIGRAVLKDTPYLLFDEPTASLDADSERYIKEAIKEILSGKTVLIIAHRLSTIRNADRILVMDKGKIVESGSHKELMILNGRYADLIRAQETGGCNLPKTGGSII
jgi:ATP-binding cassette, subfamily C, bacterial CydD